MANPKDVTVSIDLSRMTPRNAEDPSGSGLPAYSNIEFTPDEVDPGKKGNFSITFSVTKLPPGATSVAIKAFRFVGPSPDTWHFPKNDPNENSPVPGTTEDDEFQFMGGDPFVIKDKNDNSAETEYRYVLEFEAVGISPTNFVNDPRIKNW